LQPVSIIEGAVAEPRADLPAIDVFHSAGEERLHFGFASFHSFDHSCLLLRRERLEVELLSRANAKASELRPDLLLFRTGRSELQLEVEVIKEAGLGQFLVNLREIDF